MYEYEGMVRWWVTLSLLGTLPPPLHYLKFAPEEFTRNDANKAKGRRGWD